jgi:hypothetical protein
MDDGAPGGGLSQLLRDPVRVRKPANLTGLILAALSSLSFVFLDDGAQELALGICWLMMFPVALLHGWATAFFLEHGIGVRRAAAELVVGTLIALTACALLTFRGEGTSGLVVELASSLALYAAVFRALSAGVGLGVGRGAGYLGKRVQDVDDAGW